jgi:hypothetical protein
MSRILLCLSHSIEEYDQLRLLSSLGHEVASIGGYIDPAHPHVDIRPPLTDVPMVPSVKAAVDGLNTADNLGAAQEHIPDAILDWLGDDGIIIYHHYLERLVGQWPRIRDWMQGSGGRRVIWRTVGQSVAGNEAMMAPLRADGLERVAYSPKEANIPGYIGHDALIRFYKDPDEWKEWHGTDAKVINFTQHLAQREPYTNYGFWRAATQGLYAVPAGPGSEVIRGVGALSTDEMRAWLKASRVYLYTGTQPASYTLGLIEAMMTGIPVVSIHPSWMRVFPYGPNLFEGHELATYSAQGIWPEDHVASARAKLTELLNDHDLAKHASAITRQRAIDLFGMDTVREQWRAFLGGSTIEDRIKRYAGSAA